VERTVRQVLARLLESYDMQRKDTPEAYLTEHEVAAIIMSAEDAEAIREALLSGFGQGT